MTIGQSLKKAITDALIHSIFRERSAEYLAEVLSKPIKGSDTMFFLPPIPKVEVKTLDDTHDEWKFIFEDITITGVVTWVPSTIRAGQVVFTGIE